MIRIEDNFEDVLGKAMTGLGMSVDDLAKASGLKTACLQSLLRGTLDPDALKAVAGPLELSSNKLLAMARENWRPQVDLPAHLRLFNTPFPLPGYEAMTVNSYLFWSGSEAIAIDSGATAEPLLKTIAEQELQLKAVLLTHTHRDHIAALESIRRAHPATLIYSPEGEALPESIPLAPGATLNCGKLMIEARETSGHSPGALSYLVNDERVPIAFVGDALFCLSIGKASSRSYRQALENNRRELLSRPEKTLLCPGHGPVTTVGEEKAHNPFF